MSAQPVHEEDPQDPQLILERLPEQVRRVFLTEYQAAVVGARAPAGYRVLRDLLRTWSVLAAAYTKPDFHQRYADIRGGVGETVSMDEVFRPRPA
ncbi:DUF6247 family protein [Spirillospora sp. NBC_01491]|uniref:DUF6247 family protein n=1 Tax=Spirillospora sp. NBC_01491 TaxID=2976007 RepID=UPI002E34EBDE|nr:DUF6247 family protein [Spirillospora sp. NBC_01491]